jgi:hypothetical protein
MSAPANGSGAVPEFPLLRLPSGKVDVSAWTKQLGVQPVHDINELSGGWPDDEFVDDFLAARREWRSE